ncbi:MAG: metallophosphoesterase [Candidatus Cloacimonetes bacterium]|nr:metallophosphoesterase [Candidatus Cloacimonadota bacterium]
MKTKIIFLLILTLSFGIFQKSQSQIGRVGQPPLTGDPDDRQTSMSRILENEPVVKVFTKDGRKKAIITFKTISPLPAAYCHYGTYLSDQKVRTPVYRHFGKEKLAGNSLHHSITIDLSRLEYPLYDFGGVFAPQGGGTVCYRLMLPDPERSTTHIFDRRFEYRGNRDVVCITEGPWIDITSPNGFTISWNTDRLSRGTVVVDGISYESPKNTHHEVVIDNYSGVNHKYQVKATSDSIAVSTPVFKFKTPDSSGKFLFAAMSDSRSGFGGFTNNSNGVNIRILRRLFIDAYSRGAEFIIFAGDLINGHTTDEKDYIMQLQSWKDAVEPVGHIMPIFEGMGNHDLVLDYWKDPRRKYGIRMDKVFGNSSEDLFAQEFVNPINNYPEKESSSAPTYKENVYYFDWDNIRFISVNSNYWWAAWAEDIGGNIQGYILKNQMKWLEKVLEESESNKKIKHVFVFTHEPSFPVSSHLSDAMWYSGGSPESNRTIDNKPLNREYVIKFRDRFWKALSQNGKVRALIAGHEHNYVRMLIDSKTHVYLDGSSNDEFKNPVYQLITGGAGAPYYARIDVDIPWENAIKTFSSQEHYLLFKVDEKDIYLYVISSSQEIIESLKIVENGKIVEIPLRKETLSRFK